MGRRGPDHLPRRLWSAEDDDLLRALMAEKLSRKEVAERLGRTEWAIGDRCRRLGLEFDKAVARQRAAVAMSKVYSDPSYKAKLSKAISRAWSPERRAAMREAALERRFWEEGHKTLREDPEARARQKARAAQAGREWGEKRMAWCPPKFREEYRFLTRRKNLTPIEARALLQPRIDAWLGSFEGQLWKVSTGQARVVPNAKVSNIPFSHAGGLMGSGLAGLSK